MAKKKSLEEIIEILEEENPSIEILGEYSKKVGVKKPRVKRFIKCKCKIDGHTWDAETTTLLNGRGCIRCSARNSNKDKIIPISNMKERLKTINPDIKILSDKTVKANVKLACKCLVCNHQWEITWNNLQRRHGCPKCATKRITDGQRLTIDKIREMIKDVNENVEILSEIYENAHIKLKCKCLKEDCNSIFYANWNNLSFGKGCPNCAIRDRADARRLSLEEVKNQIFLINPNISILSARYINSSSKLKCCCLSCGNIWKATYSNLKKGRSCPICAKNKMKKEGHPMWKGGITPLHNYLRKNIGEWKQDSIKNSNFKCVITGKRFDVIHHVYSFDKILKETLETLDLPLYEKINEYTDYQLEQIKKVCLELHYKYGLGVCLTNKLHKKFHYLHGSGDNTKEQFEIFKQNEIKLIENK